MNLLSIITLLFLGFLTACSGFRSPREENPRFRDDTRRGNVHIDDQCGVEYECDADGDRIVTDTPESLLGKAKNALKGFTNKFRDCQTSTAGLSLNESDLVLGALGIPNPLAGMRTCIFEKIERASEAICEHQEQIYILDQKYRNYNLTKDRTSSNLRAAKETEEDFRQLLREQAERWDQTHKERGSFATEYIRGEANTIARHLYRESELSCYSSSRHRY